MPPSPVAALSSGFDGARAVAVDLSGNVYFSSGKRWIFRVNVTGVRTLVAGMGTTGYSGDGGPAISAQLNYAEGLAVDGGGNLYVADLMNNRVRKISPTGIISTVAGSGAPYYSGDGGRAVDAAVGGPYDVAVDHAGNLLIASGGCQCIRRVGSDGAIATIAGNGSTGFSGDGGPARSAQFSQPRRIALDNSGNIYVSDAANHRIRRISSNGVITTIAGNGVQGSSGDGGPAVNAQLNEPWGLAVDSGGSVYVSEHLNPRIRRIAPNGVISTFVAGTPLYYSSALTIDNTGSLYAASGYVIRKILPSGSAAIVAGNGSPAPSGDGGLALNGQLDEPTAITFDRSGSVYILERGQEPRVRKVTPVGMISTVSASGGWSWGLAVDNGGNVYFGEITRVRRVAPNGTSNIFAGNDTTQGFAGDGGPATSALLRSAEGIAFDNAGNLYIADRGNNRVRKVSTAGIITTVAGGGTAAPGDGGPALNAALTGPYAVAVDGIGNLYIMEDQSNRVRKVSPSGTITTLAIVRPRTTLRGGIAADAAGNVFFSDRATNVQMITPDGRMTRIAGNDTFGYSGDGGPAVGAAFNSPQGVAVDSAGNVFVADSENDVVRVLRPVALAAPSSLLPSSTIAGGPAFIVTVNGAGFLNGAIVLWNGLPLSTTYVNANRITATVPANLVLSPGNATVSVQNPSGIPSDSLIFTIGPPQSAGFGIVTSSPLPSGTFGVAYSQGLTATGGTSPYRVWSLISGRLPTGLSLSAGVLTGTGLLSGTPTSAGAFTFTLQITDNANATATREFVLTITGGPTTLLATGIVNSASYEGGSVSPGEIVTIFGSFPGPSNIATLQLDNRGYVATSLSGEQVLFDGTAAPLIYAVAGQVSAIVPYGVSGKASTQVQISYQGQLSNSVAMPVTPVLPGIFTADSSGRGQGAIVNQDGTVNSTSNPAATGSIVFVYATGEGQTNPGGVDGKPSDAPAPTPTNQPVTATVGGLNAQVLYAGGVPGLVAGLLQVNVQLPPAVAPGSAVPVVLTIGGKSSQANVTFAIR